MFSFPGSSRSIVRAWGIFLSFLSLLLACFLLSPDLVTVKENRSRGVERDELRLFSPKPADRCQLYPNAVSKVFHIGRIVHPEGTTPLFSSVFLSPSDADFAEVLACSAGSTTWVLKYPDEKDLLRVIILHKPKEVSIALWTTKSLSSAEGLEIVAKHDFRSDELGEKVDYFFSYISDEGFPTSTDKWIQILGCKRILFIPHLDSLLDMRQLTQLHADSRLIKSSQKCSRILSIGNSNRDHAVSISAAQSAGIDVMIIGTRQPGVLCSEGNRCKWFGKVDRPKLLREIADVETCLVMVPFTSRKPKKLGEGITSLTEVVSRGKPVVTADYSHFTGYVKHGWNAQLVGTVNLHEGNKKNLYALAVKSILRNITEYNNAAEVLSYRFTVQAVAAAIEVGMSARV